MNIREFRKQEETKNLLKDSYIEFKYLYQCRELTPERIEVGKDENNNTIFFEETSGSLQRRHYGKSDKATSYNLIYSDGEKAHLVTKTYLRAVKIDFNDGYDMEMLFDFLKNNNHRFNALNNEKRRNCFFYLSEREIELVKEFIKKMRMWKDER